MKGVKHFVLLRYASIERCKSRYFFRFGFCEFFSSRRWACQIFGEINNRDGHHDIASKRSRGTAVPPQAAVLSYVYKSLYLMDRGIQLISQLVLLDLAGFPLVQNAPNFTSSVLPSMPRLCANLPVAMRAWQSLSCVYFRPDRPTKKRTPVFTPLRVVRRCYPCPLVRPRTLAIGVSSLHILF